MASIYKKSRDRKRRGAAWYISYRDASGKSVSVKGCSDYEATKLMARELETAAELQRRGIVSDGQARCATQSKRPLSEHIGEFVQTVEGRGRAARYVQQVRSRLDAFVEFAECKRIGEITAERATTFVLLLRGRKMSAYTIREYVNTLKAFAAWAVLTSRLQSDPLLSLGRLDSKALHKTRPRRALTADEIGALLQVTLSRPLDELLMIRIGPRKGQRVAKVKPAVRAKAEALGRERHVAYLLALWTGLRRSEMRAIAWGDVQLETLPARLEIRKGDDKSKRGDVIALHPQIARELRRYKPKSVTPADKLLRTVPGMKVLKADLKAAGVDFETRAGRFDLHAMRKSLNTYLASQGVGQRIAQAHLRHQDPRLTAGAYTDETLLPVAARISELPDFPTTAKRPSRRRRKANA